MFKFNPLTGDLDLVNGQPKTVTVSIPSGSTVTVDSVLYASIKSIDYFISLYKPDFTKAKSLKMTVTKINSDLSDTVYSRVGNDVDCSVIANKVGLNANLIITNNEAFSIECSFKKQTLN
jgi:hypothetical protein